MKALKKLQISLQSFAGDLTETTLEGKPFLPPLLLLNFLVVVIWLVRTAKNNLEISGGEFGGTSMEIPKAVVATSYASTAP